MPFGAIQAIGSSWKTWESIYAISNQWLELLVICHVFRDEFQTSMSSRCCLTVYCRFRLPINEQDCIENLFFQVRQCGGTCENPEPQAFRFHLQNIMVDSVMSPIASATSNCELDLDKYLFDLQSLSLSSCDFKVIDDGASYSTALPRVHQVSTEHDYSISNFAEN